MPAPPGKNLHRRKFKEAIHPRVSGSAIHQGETSSASRRRRDALIDGRTVRKWPRSGIIVRAKKGEPLGAWLITSGSVRLPCGVRAVNAAAGVDVYLRTRAMAAQDGSASAIYSTRETGTLLLGWDGS